MGDKIILERTNNGCKYQGAGKTILCIANGYQINSEAKVKREGQSAHGEISSTLK